MSETHAFTSRESRLGPRLADRLEAYRTHQLFVAAVGLAVLGLAADALTTAVANRSTPRTWRYGCRTRNSISPGTSRVCGLVIPTLLARRGLWLVAWNTATAGELIALSRTPT